MASGGYDVARLGESRSLSLLRARLLLDPDVWGALATEARAKRLGVPPLTRPLTWPLSGFPLGDVRVEWPIAYEWGPSTRWVEPLRKGLADLVRVVPAAIEQRTKGIVTFRLIVGDDPAIVTVDYSDYPDLDARCLDESAFYFKMQHRIAGYGDERVFPGGFVGNDLSLVSMLPHLRSLRAKQRFRHGVHGRFGLASAEAIRQRAIELLEGQSSFDFEGGAGPLRYSIFLRQVARSKACVDLPGRGPFCFRLVDYLAVGSLVVGPRHRATLHVPLIAGEHVVYCKDDLSDLVSLCAAYVEDDSERERIAANARRFYDSYLEPRQLAAYYLHTCLSPLA